MPLPIKALKKSQLISGAAISDSSHKTYPATFIEDTKEISGFFKELASDKDYPEFLAKISVAGSLFLRLYQGVKAAEERLVFDDNGKIVGTFSICVPNFKPFNFSSEATPCDETLRERVVPSTKTLIEANINETLLPRLVLNDDDVHPHNISLAGQIDFDMLFNWFTVYIKVPRPFIGVMNNRPTLTIEDWETFPILKTPVYHWPTNKYSGKGSIPNLVPGQGMVLRQVLPKNYTDPSQFANLAGEPVAQEQKLAAALRMLITYQPEMMRQRLIELFGDMPINYTSLEGTSKELRETYEELFPWLCNKDTDTKPFVDFMMTLYQLHYDSLYRVVVFYMGCDNNGHGLSLPATNEALYLKPSYYRSIEQWAIKQNEILYAKDAPKLKFNLDELQKRYHQIWRDAFTPSLKSLLHGSYHLTHKILHKVAKKVTMVEAVGRRTSDAEVVSAWQIFGTMPEISIAQIKQTMVVDEDSTLREAMIFLAQFTKDFHDATKEYYQKSHENLTEQDNLIFCEKLNSLYTLHNLNIRQELAKEMADRLGHTSSFATEFNQIATSLHQLIERVNFKVHLTTNDEFMKNKSANATYKESTQRTVKELLKLYNDALFNWARGVKPENFDGYVIEIINKHYTSSVSATRLRGQPVKDYLLASKGMSCDERLAYILSSGNDESELNKLLIEHLTPRMLETEKLGFISDAIKNKTFKEKIDVYTKSAVAFAKNDPRFVHLYSVAGINLFYKTMFEWVQGLERPKFMGIVESALHKYKKGLFRFSTSREFEVSKYYTYSNQAKILALIFQNGSETSTLNKILFQKILATMKENIGKKIKSEKLITPGYKLIMDYEPDEHEVHLSSYKMLLDYSEEAANDLDYKVAATYN